MNRYKIFLMSLLIIPVLVFSDTPPPAPVCSLIGTTYSDSVVNPPSGEDMPLLTQKSVPPNVVILLDNSGSMRALPCDFDMSGGCRSSESYEGVPELDISSAATGYNPATTYPCPDPLDLDITPNADNLTGAQATNYPACFTSDRVYEYTVGIPPVSLVNLSTCTSNPTTIRRSCRTICGATSSCTGTCMTNCVNGLTNNGYYYTGSREYYLGNFLNYYPPKYLIARRAIKLTVYNMSKVKFGLFSFEPGWWSPFGADINNFGAVSPVCDQSACPKCFEGCPGYDNAIKNAKAGIIGLVNNTQFDTWTPLAESLFNIGQYFARRTGNRYGPYDNFPSTYRKNLGGLSNVAMDYVCQKNFVIIVTDGQPTMDLTIPTSPTNVQDYDGDCREEVESQRGCPGFTPRPGCPRCSSGQFCPASSSQECCTGCGASSCTDIAQHTCPIGSIHPCSPCYNSDGSDYLDDVAKWLAETDLVPSSETDNDGKPFDGVQNVYTYTIGFGLSGQTKALSLLQRTADKSHGDGLFFSTNNATELANALTAALSDIIRRSVGFTSTAQASLQVTAQGDSVIGRFLPTNLPVWDGQLYKFVLFSEFNSGVDRNGDGDTKDMYVLDKDGDEIVQDTTTGALLKKSGGPANPVWEAGACLSNSSLSCYRSPDENQSNKRKIYTVIDSDSNGKFDSNDQVIEFTIANANLLQDYLGIEGNNFCSQFATTLGLSSLTKLQCAKLIIRFVRGQDILDWNGNCTVPFTDPDNPPSCRTEPRENILGDIFHAQPVEIKPPIEKDICDTAAEDQCLWTLYTTSNADIETYIHPVTGKTIDAYDYYQYQYSQRMKLLAVNANDGMLHFFNNGDAVNLYGTGEEVLAFIPPDLLTKIKLLTNRHHFYIDAPVMVRDIWKDGSNGEPNDEKKQWREYHTILISGERRGGTHFFALDITDIPNLPPKFIWLFPQPGSPDNLKMGETWSDYKPQGPPIYSILLAKDGYPAGVERYIAFLNGGFDVYNLKGRAVFGVDAYTGEKLWEFSYAQDGSERENLLYSIPAPFGAVDCDSISGGAFKTCPGDGFFNIGFFVDTGGQLWGVDMSSPGVIGVDGLISNWQAVRIFTHTQRLPFFYTPASVIPFGRNFVEVFLGTGNRLNLAECGGGECSVYNPNACVRGGCNVQASINHNVDGGTLSVTRNLTSSGFTESYSLTPGSGVPSCDFSYAGLTDISGCPPAMTGNEKDCQVGCSNVGGNFSCSESCNFIENKLDLSISNPPNIFLAFNIFYPFNPADYSPPLTELSPNIVDVSSGLVGAPESGIAGWFIRYIDAPHADENGTPMTTTISEATAGGANIIPLTECVTWPTFDSNCGGSAPRCGGTVGQGFIFSVNYLTGLKEGCSLNSYGSGTYMGGLIPPPVEIVVQVSERGILSTPIITAPGNREMIVTTTGGATPPAGSLIYWLEIPKALHDCRHKNNCP